MSSSFIVRPLAALSVVAALGSVASPARAGVVYLNQGRVVEAEASHNMNPEVSDIKSAPDFAPFDGRALAHLVDDEDGDFATAAVTQNSRLGSAGITASGGFTFDIGGEFGRGRSVLSVLFDVTGSPQDFTLRYDLGPVTSELGVLGVPFHANLLLRRFEGPAPGTPADIVLPVDTDLAWDAPDSGPNRVTDMKTGTLAPGRYGFDLDIQGFSVDFNHGYGAAYDLTLDFQDAGPGPTPNPVPLPPAVWTGLAGLAAVGAGMRFRKRIA